MQANRFKHHWPQTPQEHTVLVLGASPKPERYANQAICLLRDKGYRVVPVHPRIAVIEDLPVVHTLRTVHERVHTLTLYVGPQRSQPMIGDIVALNPGRVIFNPGTESEELEDSLRSHHVECIHGCTLVMLKTGQF